jgi:hypothetical protein
VKPHLEVSRDDKTTLDGRPVPLVMAPLLSTVLGKGVDGGGLRDSVELSFDQYAIISFQYPNHAHLEFVYGTDEDVGDPGEEVPFTAELLAPDPPADELVSDGTAGVHVTGGTELSPVLASKLSSQLISCHTP